MSIGIAKSSCRAGAAIAVLSGCLLAAWPVHLALSAEPAATATPKSATPLPTPRAPSFFWKLSLEPGSGPGPSEVELLPAGGGSRELVVRISSDRVALLATGADGGERELAGALLEALPRSAVLAGRAGIWTLSLDGRAALRAESPAAPAARPAFRVLRGTPSIKELRRTSPEPLVFEDPFSRPAGEAGPWARRSGNWESAARYFAELSANSGALRARFAGEAPGDPLAAGRTEERKTGLGLVLAPCGSALCVERIAGGSPAERAGLSECDVIVRGAGGQAIRDFAMSLMGLGGRGRPEKPVELDVLHPGARELSKVTIVPGDFVWGENRRVVALPGAAAASAALALSGEDFWRPARVEASARRHGPAGFGLAFAAADDGSALVFRLRPAPDGAGDGAGWLAELARCRPDGTDAGTPLAAAKPGIPWPDSWYRLAVELSDDGRTPGALARCLVGDREVLRTSLPSAGCGPVGMWAAGTDGWVEFDDFAAADDPAELARRALRPAGFSPIAAAEPDMGSWAAAASDWRAAGEKSRATAEWRYPCLSGAEARLDELPKAGPVEIAWAPGPEAPGSAGPCSVRIEPSGRVEVRSGERALGSAELPAAGPYLARLAAGTLSVSAGGRELVRAGVGAAPRELLTVRPGGAAFAGRVGVRPVGGLDLAFDRAPVELVATAGIWGLTTKWVCDPRWSWFGGRGAPLASVWTARTASGDQQLDAFAALMMQRLNPPFERAHDFGLALCGDGRSLWSGYTLVFGADGNRSTRLYRRGVLVAETDAAEARFPADTFATPGRHELHQRWFRLTLARRGARLAFLLDGVERLAWTDPEPLESGRAAAWTLDNGMMLARLRLDAARLGPAEPDLGAPGEPRPGQGFEAPGEYGPTPRILPAAGGPTRVEAVSGGGPLAVRAAGLVVNPRETRALSLGLRAPEGTAVDLFLEGAHESFRVGLAGPPPAVDAPERDIRWLGQADSAPGRDGARELSVPLDVLWRDYWARRLPNEPPPAGEYRVLVGCRAGSGPAAMGLGANRPGAWYEVSAIRAETGQAGDKEPPQIGELRCEPGTEHSRARLVLPLADPAGSGLDRRSLRIELDGHALVLTSPGVAYSERSGKLVIDLAATGASAGPDGSHRLKLAGLADLAGNKREAVELAVAPPAGADRRPPEKIRVRALIGVPGAEKEHRAGNGAAAGEQGQPGPLELPLDLGPESLQPGQQAPRHFFEWLLPEGPGAPEGCAIISLCDGGDLAMAATLPGGALDLGRVPEIEFSSRSDSVTPFMVDAYGDGWNALAPLRDRFLPANAFMVMRGRVPGAQPVVLAFRADGAWHRTALPLAAICRQGTPRPGPLVAKALRFGDVRYNNNRTGMHFELAGLRLVPAVRPDELVFSWSAWDEGGVAACRSAFDQSPDTVPREAELESGRPLPGKVRAGLKDGPAWLHLAFADKAGNWSVPVHYRVLLDSTPPAAVASSSGHGIELALTDATGIDPRQMRLEVNGREFKPGPRGPLVFEAASGRLTWNARAAIGRTIIDGEIVTYRLTAADFAGNRTDPPIAGECRVSFAADREPPEAPGIRVRAQSGWHGFFGRRLGEVGPLSSSARVEPTGVPGGPDPAGFKLSRTDDPAQFRTLLRAGPWSVDHTPVVTFDCRPATGAGLELHVDVSGHRLSAPLTGPGGLALADGRWHRVALDLGALVRERVGALPAAIGRNLEIREARSADGGADAYPAAGLLIELESLALVRPASATPTIELSSTEADSGVAGFAVAIDRNPDTVPERRINAPAASADGRATFKPPEDLAPGDWWAHAMAVDFAGNWSAPMHYRIVVPPAAPAPPAADPEANQGEAQE
mgnify:CR=1 FL=1